MQMLATYPVPHPGPATRPYAVSLYVGVNRVTPYVVWFESLEGTDRWHGVYCATAEQAITTYRDRVRREAARAAEVNITTAETLLRREAS